MSKLSYNFLVDFKILKEKKISSEPLTSTNNSSFLIKLNENLQKKKKYKKYKDRKGNYRFKLSTLQKADSLGLSVKGKHPDIVERQIIILGVAKLLKENKYEWRRKDLVYEGYCLVKGIKFDSKVKEIADNDLKALMKNNFIETYEHQSYNGVYAKNFELLSTNSKSLKGDSPEILSSPKTLTHLRLLIAKAVTDENSILFSRKNNHKKYLQIGIQYKMVKMFTDSVDRMINKDGIKDYEVYDYPKINTFSKIKPEKRSRIETKVIALFKIDENNKKKIRGHKRIRGLYNKMWQEVCKIYKAIKLGATTKDVEEGIMYLMKYKKNIKLYLHMCDRNYFYKKKIKNCSVREISLVTATANDTVKVTKPVLSTNERREKEARFYFKCVLNRDIENFEYKNNRFDNPNKFTLEEMLIAKEQLIANKWVIY